MSIDPLKVPGQPLRVQTAKDFTAGSGITFEDRAERELKGVPDRWHLYALVSDGA